MRANCGVLFTYFFQTVLCSQHHAPKHEEHRMNRITIALACALLATSAATVTAGPLSPLHSKCIAQAESSMPDMIQCSEEEAERQDARLNVAYKAAMARVENKDALRAAQRKWIAYRNKACPAGDGGGQAGVLNATECIAIKSARRAEELERM